MADHEAFKKLFSPPIWDAYNFSRQLSLCQAPTPPPEIKQHEQQLFPLQPVWDNNNFSKQLSSQGSHS
jgi:hypothetical protein